MNEETFHVRSLLCCQTKTKKPGHRCAGDSAPSFFSQASPRPLPTSLATPIPSSPSSLPPFRSLARPLLCSIPYDPDDRNYVHRPPIQPQAIPLHLASHILSTSRSTYSLPYLCRLPNHRCHHQRSGQRRRCKEHPPSKLSSRGACRHRWRIFTSFLGRACKYSNDQCSPWDHGGCTHRVDSQVSVTFPL